MKGLKVFYLIIYITEMSNQPSFNELARQSGYKGSAMTKGKLSRNYKMFVARIQPTRKTTQDSTGT